MITTEMFVRIVGLYNSKAITAAEGATIMNGHIENAGEIVCGPERNIMGQSNSGINVLKDDGYNRY